MSAVKLLVLHPVYSELVALVQGETKFEVIENIPVDLEAFEDAPPNQVYMLSGAI